jgi:hypothetical protein
MQTNDHLIWHPPQLRRILPLKTAKRQALQPGRSTFDSSEKIDLIDKLCSLSGFSIGWMSRHGRAIPAVRIFASHKGKSMFNFFGNGQNGTFCDGLSRRHFLKIGGVAMAGLSLPELLRAEEAAGPKATKKNIINIILGGGPSHMDSSTLNQTLQRSIVASSLRLPRPCPASTSASTSRSSRRWAKRSRPFAR